MTNKKAVLDDLARYWDELRGHRMAPRRTDLNPSRFGAALEHMFILETVAGGPLRIRLAGTRLCDLMGMEPRGMPARAIFAERDQMRADDLLHEVVSHPAKIDIGLSVTALGGQIYEGGMILRPMTDDFGDITRVLGCLATDAPRHETELGLTIGTIRVDTLREGQMPKRGHAPAMGFAEEQAPFDGPHLRSVSAGGGRTRPERKPLSRSHLRIVSSRD